MDQPSPNIAPTRLFRNGNSQAVRIPKALAFDSVDIEVESPQPGSARGHPSQARSERRGEELIVRPAKQRLTGLGAAFRRLAPHFRGFVRDQPVQSPRDAAPKRPDI